MKLFGIFVIFTIISSSIAAVNDALMYVDDKLRAKSSIILALIGIVLISIIIII